MKHLTKWVTVIAAAVVARTISVIVEDVIRERRSYAKNYNNNVSPIRNFHIYNNRAAQ